MKSKRAVALHYEKQTDAAPRVVAKGADAVAEAILASARQHDVPILQNEALIQSLMALQLDAVIPEDLYEVVAAILAFIYKQKSEHE